MLFGSSLLASSSLHSQAMDHPKVSRYKIAIEYTEMVYYTVPWIAPAVWATLSKIQTVADFWPP